MIIYYTLIAFFLTLSIVFFVLFLQKDRAYRRLLKKNLPRKETESFILAQKIKFEEITPIDNTDKDLLEKLQYILETEKVYLNKDLNMNILSKKIGTNKSTLSRIINTYFSKNFPCLINEYRINAAIQMLMNPKSIAYKMEYISELVGYNNRQVFHYAFKKATGLTPQRFRNVCRKEFSVKENNVQK